MIIVGLMLKKKNMKNQLSKLPALEKFREFTLVDVLMVFDATKFYPSAMWHENSIYAIIETGDVFTPDMIEEFVEKFNNYTFRQGCAILIVLCYDQPCFLFQLLSDRKSRKTDSKRMKNVYFFDFLTSVDIQEITNFVGKIS